jgi:hypothetical protein
MNGSHEKGESYYIRHDHSCTPGGQLFKEDNDVHFGITRQCPLAMGPMSMNAKIVSVSRSFILHHEHHVQSLLPSGGGHTKGSPLNVSIFRGIDKPLMILQKIHLDINTRQLDYPGYSRSQRCHIAY